MREWAGDLKSGMSSKFLLKCFPSLVSLSLTLWVIFGVGEFLYRASGTPLFFMLFLDILGFLFEGKGLLSMVY